MMECRSSTDLRRACNLTDLWSSASSPRFPKIFSVVATYANSAKAVQAVVLKLPITAKVPCSQGVSPVIANELCSTSHHPRRC